LNRVFGRAEPNHERIADRFNDGAPIADDLVAHDFIVDLKLFLPWLLHWRPFAWSNPQYL